MSYSLFDLLKLIGAMGLFLYGMKIMSEGLQKMAGEKLRNVLSAMTKNRFMGVFTGFLLTAIIQSSTATTVMVVSFVNAGLLLLAQAISVIMGANIGTTFTAWIISFFGFKFDISIIALPLIGLSLPLIFSSKSKRKSLGEFVVGFALLFMGLAFLKDSVPNLQSNPDMLAFLQRYTEMGYGSILLFFLIGAIVTIIVQSSSATIAITLVMCSQGWISYEIACAMVLGENLGTTITANVAAIPANASAKRAAFAHLLFNTFGVVWMLIVFYPFVGMVASTITKIGPGNPYVLKEFLNTLDPDTIKLISSNVDLTDSHLIDLRNQMQSLQLAVSYSLSFYHTSYNVINVLIMVWFVKYYVIICNKLIKNKNTDEEFQLKFISSSMLSTGELSIMEAKSELIVFAERSHRMMQMVKELNVTENESDYLKIFERIEKYEDISDRLELEIANYLNKVAESHLSSKTKEEIRDLLRANTEIESVSDAFYNMSKAIKRRNTAKSKFTDEMNENIDSMLNLCNRAMDRMILILKMKETKETDIDLTYNLESEINHFRNILKSKNIEDVNAHKYHYQDGVFYMDFISECERLGDYIVNVVEAVCGKGSKQKT